MSQPSTSPWLREEVVDRLKVLWVDHSASQIMAVLAREFGVSVTRNGVVGKLHRMQLTISDKHRTHPQTRERGPRGPNTRTRSTPFRAQLGFSSEQTSLRCVEAEPRNLTLMQLQPNDCRFIANDDRLYCGHPKLQGYSFCGPHAALVWVKPQVRKQVRAFA